MAKFPSTGRAVRAARPARKPRDAYHHGNLRQALLDQAVATIRDRGVEALTLRDVGERLRVSRTALYRHFADKQALLAAVATEGFRAFRQALVDAWDGTGHTRDGFLAQGLAYVAFARANPSHYRVMFGGFVAKADCDPELRTTAASAFGVLVGAVTTLQQQGLVRAGDPQAHAIFAWSAVHGLAMLVIDGQLARPGATPDAVIAASLERVWDGLAAPRA
jgi:AcrR family transcriptional regulator